MGNANSSHALPDQPPDEIFQIKIMNAGNSCYMDSVLFAMFAVPSPSLDSLLTKRLSNADLMARQKQELQSCILKQFVSRIRHCENVSSEMVSNIRALCRKVGWEYAGAPDQQQDAGEFFSFLYGGLGGQLIRTTRKTFTGALPDNSDKGREENMTLLPIGLCDAEVQQDQALDLSNLLDTFFYENVASGLRRKLGGQEQEVWALNTYAVENVPSLVAVSLKRFDENLLKIESEVQFPSQINLHKYSGRPEWRTSPVMHSVAWNLRSIVCHRGGSTQSGHYYAYTRYSQHDSSSAIWLRMDDAGSPCITQTNVWSDPYVKSEAVLFLYELDTDAHTAALMMLQEENDGGGQGVYGGFGGIGSGGQYGNYSSSRSMTGSGGTNYGSSTSKNAIPGALDATFLSNVLNAVASSSTRHQASSNNAPPQQELKRGHPNSGKITDDDEAKLASGVAKGNSSLEQTNDANKQSRDNSISNNWEEAPEHRNVVSHSSAETETAISSANTADRHISAAKTHAQHHSVAVHQSSSAVDDASSHDRSDKYGFLIAPNGAQSVAATRRSEAGEDGSEVWVAEVLMDPSREPLVAVTAMPCFSWEGRVSADATVKLAGNSEDQATFVEKKASLSQEYPTAILSCAGTDGTPSRISVVIEVPSKHS